MNLFIFHADIIELVIVQKYPRSSIAKYIHLPTGLNIILNTISTALYLILLDNEEVIPSFAPLINVNPCFTTSSILKNCLPNNISLS